MLSFITRPTFVALPGGRSCRLPKKSCVCFTFYITGFHDVSPYYDLPKSDRWSPQPSSWPSVATASVAAISISFSASISWFTSFKCGVPEILLCTFFALSRPRKRFVYFKKFTWLLYFSVPWWLWFMTEARFCFSVHQAYGVKVSARRSSCLVYLAQDGHSMMQRCPHAPIQVRIHLFPSKRRESQFAVIEVMKMIPGQNRIWIWIFNIIEVAQKLCK